MDRNQGLAQLISHENVQFCQASFCPAIQNMSSEWMNRFPPYKTTVPNAGMSLNVSLQSRCSLSCLELSPGPSSPACWGTSITTTTTRESLLTSVIWVIRPPVFVNNSHTSSRNPKFPTGFKENRKPLSLPGEHFPRYLFGRWCSSGGRVAADTRRSNSPRVPTSPLRTNGWAAHRSIAQDGDL